MADLFKLSDEFVNSYANKEVKWGYTDGAGNALGEITTLRTYSRKKPDGTKERWHEICRRVIEGMFTLQKRHCRSNNIEWKNEKAQRTAKDAFDRMFNMKWLPPGRGMWAGGTSIVMEEGNSAPLMNCAFTSTKDSIVDAVEFLFDASMLGVGVGFDSDGAGKFNVLEPVREGVYAIPDSREGWVESLKILMSAYIDEGKKRNPLPKFDYSEIRPEGSPIKRFGGVASGPAPLVHLHNMVSQILENRIGSPMTMIDINDCCNLVGQAVIAGNIRRSAEISFIDSDSQDVDDFTNLKNSSVFPDRQQWGWVSNNSIRAKVGQDYSKFTDGIKLNGEPGLVWMDVVRGYGRLKDPKDNKDYRAHGLNPCSFAGEALVHTTEGPKTIEELEDSPFWAMVNGEAYYSPVGSYITGRKELYTLHTKEGFEVILTDNHEVLTKDSGWKESGALEPGEKIILHNHRSVPTWMGTGGSWDDGYIVGSVVGDGSLNAKGHGRLGVWSNGDEESAHSMMDQMKHSLKKSYAEIDNDRGINNIRSDVKVEFTYRPKPYDMYYMTVSSKLLKKYGIVFGNKTTTLDIERASSEFQRGYLRGIFDADGHIEGWKDSENYKGSTIRLSQTDITSLKAIQRMLLRFGIVGRIYKAREAGSRPMPDGRGGIKDYMTKASYRLVIGADSYPRFAEMVGFSHAEKAKKVGRVLETRNFYASKFEATFESLDYLRTDDVWDLSVSTKKAFDANGLFVHNSEQPLEDKEVCTLCEVFIGNCDDVDDFVKTLKVAYLYGKTATLLQTKWEKTNTVMLRNRRIGLSVSGVADFSDANGLPKLRETLDDGFNYILKLDKKYSDWLCIRESIRHCTVKPAGSISIVAGSSPGTHWTPGGEYFIRRITFKKTDPIFLSLKEAGYESADLEWDANSAVILFPIHSQSKRAASEVPAWEKINLAAEMQYWWSDNAVSCTVDFKPEEAEHIPTLLAMYEGKLKGISFLPSIDGGAYKNMPYEAISKEKYEDMCRTISKADFSASYGHGEEAKGEEFCTSDHCEIEEELNEAAGDMVVVPEIDTSKF